MTESEETAYMQGGRTVRINLLWQLLKELGKPEQDAHGWRIEREQAIQSLRSLCATQGDNDWPDDLSLQDIIEKHLADHLLA